MQLTIEVKDSVLDKVLYLLENLKSDVQILSREIVKGDIETISHNHSDYADLQEARKKRIHNPEEYLSMDEVNWT